MARTITTANSTYFSGGPNYTLPANYTILFRAKTASASGVLFGGRITGGWLVERTAAGAIKLLHAGVTALESSTGIFPADDSWHAFAITNDGTARFYADDTTVRGSGATGACESPGLGIFIGAFNDNTTPVWAAAPMSLAEIALFSRKLSDAEITQWMAGDSPSLYSTSLDHYWILDETSGGAAATVGGYALTEVGTVAYEAHPPMNYSGGNAAPTFTGPNIGNQTGTVGTPISASVASKFSDTDALTFSAVGSWPPGVTVSSAGVISGTPTTAGTYSTLSVRATDTAAQTVDSDVFSFTTSAAPEVSISTTAALPAFSGSISVSPVVQLGATAALPVFSGSITSGGATVSFSITPPLPTFSGAIILATGGATITITDLEDFTTGVARPNETGITAIINQMTGELVANLPGQTSTAGSDMSVSHASLVAGTWYRVTTVMPDGSEGTWKYQAV